MLKVRKSHFQTPEAMLSQMEFQEVQSFGAAIHFWPNGPGPKFWEVFQEVLFAELSSRTLWKMSSRQRLENCGSLLLAASGNNPPCLVEMRFSREQTSMGLEARKDMGSTAGTSGQGGGGSGLHVPLSLRREERPAWQPPELQFLEGKLAAQLRSVLGPLLELKFRGNEFAKTCCLCCGQQVALIRMLHSQQS